MKLRWTITRQPYGYAAFYDDDPIPRMTCTDLEPLREMFLDHDNVREPRRDDDEKNVVERWRQPYSVMQ